MLSRFFKGRAQAVKINYQEFHDFLQLDRNLTSDPDVHTIVLAALECYSLRGSTQHGPARSFYSNPDHKITQTIPVDFGGGMMTHTETYHLSPCISTTEEPAPFGQTHFCMIMREESEKPDDLYTSIIFGIRGKVDKDGDYTISKIMAPNIEDGMLTGLQNIPITDDTVHTAMLYAYECARQIYEGEQVMPRKALEFAMEYEDYERDTGQHPSYDR